MNWNKCNFITLLSQSLVYNSQTVHHSTEDADTLISQCALEIVAQGLPVNIVADDTDVLILWMYHWKQDFADVFFLSEAKK